MHINRHFILIIATASSLEPPTFRDFPVVYPHLHFTFEIIAGPQVHRFKTAPAGEMCPEVQPPQERAEGGLWEITFSLSTDSLIKINKIAVPNNKGNLRKSRCFSFLSEAVPELASRSLYDRHANVSRDRM